MLHRFFLACILTAIPAIVSAQTVTHYEQDDPRITYTGNWYPNTDPLESGGTATLTNLKGSQVIVIFNGTGINWIGESDGYSGVSYVTLDGVQTSVDTSNPASNTYYQKSLFSAHNLPAGTHRMTIEVLHQRDATTQGSWIWVDAFEVDNGTLLSGSPAAAAGTAEQTTVAANYSGQWFQLAAAQYSGGSVTSAVDANARVDFTFNGTGVTWIGYGDQWCGIAQVLVDGAQTAMVDTYLNPSQAQVKTYNISGLSAGTHVLSIVVTGTHDAASGGNWIWVDAFQVAGSGTTTPGITVAGVVNAASFAAAQVAPGQLVSLFGQNFLPAGSVTARAFPLPAALGPQNLSVTACGHTLGLYALLPGQINAQLPTECPTTGTVTAMVSVGGQTGSQTFTLAPAAPGIFTVNGSGTGDGVIVHTDYSLVTAAKPATAGETVVLYTTGLGPTSPQFADGVAANQMNYTVMPVTVSIGGKPATVTYAGLAQGWVGLYQINAVVPAGVTGSLPVIVTSAGTYSSPAGVTMSVH